MDGDFPASGLTIIGGVPSATLMGAETVLRAYQNLDGPGGATGGRAGLPWSGVNLLCNIILGTAYARDSLSSLFE